MFAVSTESIQIHMCGDTTIKVDRTSEFVSQGRDIVSARFELTNRGATHDLSLYADTPAQIAALGWAILEAAAKLRPVPTAATEAMAAVEAHADAESGEPAKVGAR